MSPEPTAMAEASQGEKKREFKQGRDGGRGGGTSEHLHREVPPPRFFQDLVRVGRPPASSRLQPRAQEGQQPTLGGGCHGNRELRGREGCVVTCLGLRG